MEIGNLVPAVCGGMKRYPRKGTYHRLKSSEVSDQTDESVVTLQGRRQNVKLLQIIATVQPKIRLSGNLFKRFRDAYVDTMLCFAEHVVNLNNGEVYSLKKIQDDVRYLTAPEEEARTLEAHLA